MLRGINSIWNLLRFTWFGFKYLRTLFSYCSCLDIPWQTLLPKKYGQFSGPAKTSLMVLNLHFLTTHIMYKIYTCSMISLVFRYYCCATGIRYRLLVIPYVFAVTAYFFSPAQKAYRFFGWQWGCYYYGQIFWIYSNVYFKGSYSYY